MDMHKGNGWTEHVVACWTKSNPTLAPTSRMAASAGHLFLVAASFWQVTTIYAKINGRHLRLMPSCQL
jgi:hypothetical protein